MNQILPDWFNQKLPDLRAMAATTKLLDGLNLTTVCQGSLCPNIFHCYSEGIATFLIMGNVCTRCCSFCAQEKGHPSRPDCDEPNRIVEAVKQLGLNYIVITSVTRDDLPDGGASHFKRTIKLLYRNLPNIKVELLVPDFQEKRSAIKKIVAAHPEVMGHNLETVPRLYQEVRFGADYQRSLRVLKMIKEIDKKMITKSGIMLGLGERREEVIAVMKDLREVGCNILTLGQYLSPSDQHHSVVRFVHPEEFAQYETLGHEMGFAAVASAPLQRSSTRAEELYSKAKLSWEAEMKSILN